ncbi:MAG: hypothetical protein ACK5HY_08455 [Parahaliea sp.]
MKTVARYMAVCGVLACATAAMAQPRPLPERVFNCQVMTKSGINGLVRVQVNNADEARDLAARSEAVDMSGRLAPALSVVVCVRQPDGRFRDGGFQKFVDELAR